jgi:hypothetical protein
MLSCFGGFREQHTIAGVICGSWESSFSGPWLQQRGYNKKKIGTDTMQQYSIRKTGKQYVVGAKGKDLLICETRSEAENIVLDVANSAETSMSGSLCTSADVLAKVVLDIKLILDIEKALRDDLATGGPRKQRQVQDQISTILDKAGAVGAAKRIQAGFRGLKVVK